MRARLGELDTALDDAREALRICRARLGEEHYRLALATADLGGLRVQRGEFEEAEALLLDAHLRLVDALGPDHRDTIAAVQMVIEPYETWGRPEEANRWRLEGESTTRAKLPGFQGGY